MRTPSTTHCAVLLIWQRLPWRPRSVAVGPGKLLDNGKMSPMDVKVGDKIIYAKYGGTEIKVDGKEYIILRQDDVLAVLEPTKKGGK